MRAVALIQARLGSHRLPGKVMLPIGGKTMLERVCDQVARIQGLDDWCVIVPDDEPLWIYWVPKVDFWRGPSEPLHRYVEAARGLDADIIMRITADCPLLDPWIASRILSEFRRDPGVGYLSNVRPVRLHPDGCDVEVFARDLLEQRARVNPHVCYETEHVTPHMPARQVPGFTSWDLGRIAYVAGADLRWTVDTAEDLEFVREVYRGLESRGLPVSIGNVLSLTPGDACEHCAAKVPHLERLAGDGQMQTNWALHQVGVEEGMRLPGGWPNYPWWARTKQDGRIFVACEAWEMAAVGGTRRLA